MNLNDNLELSSHCKRPKSAIVVEGGAMRGIFAAGVLDSFHDNKISSFDICIGVSSGATNLASYLAQQRGRNLKVISDYSCRPPFINGRKFIMGGHFLDLDWLWDIADQEYPLDRKTIDAHENEFYAVTTNIHTGQAEYLKLNEDNIDQCLKASCALPVAYRNYPLCNGIPMTDGGIADSIPVIEAYNRGARHITAVLSRPLGFRKKPIKMSRMIQTYFRKQPELGKAVLTRQTKYNQALDFINNPPSNCQLEILTPSSEFDVGRTTTHPKKLKDGYDMGYKLGTERSRKLLDINIGRRQ